MRDRPIYIDTGFLVMFSFLLLSLPIRLVIAWVLAVGIHELGHFIALRLLRIRVYSVRISVFGAVMVTEPVSGWREGVCAIAGPVAGFCVLLVARWVPCTAVFAFVHSVYNLLPIPPLDGGRVAKSIIHTLQRQIRQKMPLKSKRTNSTISKTIHLERYK